MPNEHLPPPEDFLQWLKGKRRDESVGSACNADFCPLACWLDQTVGLPLPSWRTNFSVGNTFIGGRLRDGTRVNWWHTVWSLPFMRAIDRTFLGVVTAEDAIAILIRVLMETTGLQPSQEGAC